MLDFYGQNEISNDRHANRLFTLAITINSATRKGCFYCIVTKFKYAQGANQDIVDTYVLIENHPFNAVN
jgi:hypothetical protein